MTLAIKQKLRIAFDVNGTLIGTTDSQDALAIQLLLKRLKKAGHQIIVWSGNGAEYANEKVTNLGLQDYVDEFASKLDDIERPDIAFDDVWGVLASGVTIKV